MKLLIRFENIMNKKTKINLSGLLPFLIFIFFLDLEAKTVVVNSFPNLTFLNPIDIQHAGDNSNRLFVVSQNGAIHVFENNSEVEVSSIFFNITDEVLYGGEQGLLGLAFHPDFSENGFFFVNYTAGNPRRTVIARFSVSSNPNIADPSSKIILLEINQPYSNHNGGQIAFGQDGFLYISLGDGGSGGDPQNRAQDLSTLLGKIVRIDVDHSENGKNYSVPDDNPFKNNNENIAPEIYAYGLRNVWRFSFDSNNRLWAADVGQNSLEEINIIKNGGNYGWRIMEGSDCYNPPNNCNREGLALPIWEYDHSSTGGYSITGGYLYEGNNAFELLDKYIYADFVTGNIWAFNPEDSSNILVEKVNLSISTFGVDQNNDLYFADLISGIIYKLIDDTINSVSTLKTNSFDLKQNYPNPFNPATTIRYQIPISSEADNATVKLVIYDILGRETAILIDEKQNAGYHEISWNASEFTSGIYFYKLSVGKYTKTKKMLLLN